METQVLSVEQMKHLQELGVDTSKTKISWYAIYETLPNWYNELRIRDKVFDDYYPFMPTFTLQDMLEIMPESIISDNILYHFELLKLGSSYSIGYKGIIDKIVDENNREYFYLHGADEINTIKYHILLWDKKLLTCAYEMLCWLAENGYLKGGNDEERN